MMWVTTRKSLCTTSFTILVIDLYQPINAKIDFILETISHGYLSCLSPLPVDAEYMKLFCEQIWLRRGLDRAFLDAL